MAEIKCLSCGAVLDGEALSIIDNTCPYCSATVYTSKNISVTTKKTENESRLKIFKKPSFLFPLFAGIISIIIILNFVIIPSIRYNNAVTLMDSGKGDEAISIFMELGDYRDSSLRSMILYGRTRNSESDFQNYIATGKNHLIGLISSGEVIAT